MKGNTNATWVAQPVEVKDCLNCGLLTHPSHNRPSRNADISWELNNWTSTRDGAIRTVQKWPNNLHLAYLNFQEGHYFYLKTACSWGFFLMVRPPTITWTRRCWRWVGPTYLAPSSRPSPSPTPCQGDRRHRDHEHCQQYLARAAVNSASGVRTPMNGLFTGALVILCLAFLMPYCAFIPKVKQDLKNNQNLQDHKTFWVTPEA